MGYIADQLSKYTAENSRFETSRNYVSISHASLSIEEILNQWANGFEDSLDIRLKCYKGYQMEDDLKARCKKVFGNDFFDYGEISAFNGIVKGHPDFKYQGLPGDIKTVALDEYLPTQKLPRRVYYQMQGYMLYSNTHKSLVIYESRATGKIVDFWVYPNASIQKEINDKFEQVASHIKIHG